MSSYTGIYVQRLGTGKIFSVQVVDPFGNSLPLEPDTYVQRGISPPIDQLPDLATYQNTSAAASSISPVITALQEWKRTGKASEEMIQKMLQFGFVFYDTDGLLKITPYGEQTLRDNGLA